MTVSAITTVSNSCTYPQYSLYFSKNLVNMSYALLFSTIVSRHGIRAPFSPPNITECNEYYKYSNLTFPTFEDWGMTDVTYCDQQLTPHGELVVPRMGEYYRTLYTDPDFAFSCDKVTVSVSASVPVSVSVFESVLWSPATAHARERGTHVPPLTPLPHLPHSLH